VTFTDLSGTVLEGSHVSVRIWLWGGLLFVSGCSTREVARELGVNYKTARRMVSLFQLAYLTQRFRCLLTGPVEVDEVYIIGGQKGRAGGLPLLRPPRCRGLKKRGRGTWATDKTPVLGLVDRQGHVYLIPCANVQTKTIQPFIERLVDRGATVYPVVRSHRTNRTDSYNIYTFLRRLGYQHATVNHHHGEYARGEVHVNGVEGIWSLQLSCRPTTGLRHHLRVHRGVSKVYLPLYVARFEFTFNRRDQRRWGQLVDLLSLACQADGRRLRRWVRQGRLRDACPIPGLVMA
jgi:transposase-like protein